MSHDNAFRKQQPAAADLSRLPEHLRQAYDKPVPYREGEIVVRLMTMKAISYNVPSARLNAEVVLDTPDDPKRVVLKVLDYKGVEPFAQIEIAPEKFETLLVKLLRIHRAEKGDFTSLLAALDAPSQGDTHF